MNLNNESNETDDEWTQKSLKHKRLKIQLDS